MLECRAYGARINFFDTAKLYMYTCSSIWKKMVWKKCATARATKSRGVRTAQAGNLDRSMETNGSSPCQRGVEKKNGVCLSIGGIKHAVPFGGGGGTVYLTGHLLAFSALHKSHQGIATETALRPK
jgi:hypothetical protein